MITSVELFKKNCLLLLTNPDTTQNWSFASKMLGQFFFLVLGFVFIVILAVCSLKLASRFKSISGLSSNLHILETKSLGLNNYIHLVRAGDKYIIIATSKTNISFIAEIDKETIVDYTKNHKRAKFEELLTAINSKVCGNKEKDEQNEN